MLWLRKYSPFFLAFLLLSGAFLRLYRIDEKTRFIWDEGRDMLAIRHMLVNRDLTLFGPYSESDGKKDFMGVFHYYFMAPALAIAKFDPVGPAIFTALLGIVSILFLWLLMTRWQVPLPVVWLTTALYAFSPLVVKYTQSALNPNTLPFFALLYFLLLRKFQTRPDWIHSGILGLTSGLMFQLHYFALPIHLAFFLVLLSLNQPWSKILSQILIYAAGFILPNLTFVIFDLTHQGFYSQILRDTFLGSGGQQFFRPTLFALFPTIGNYLLSVIQGLFSLSLSIAVIIVCLTMFACFKAFHLVYQSHKLSLTGIVSAIFLTFLLQISLFPRVADDYHSNWLWWGILLLMAELVYRIIHQLKINPKLKFSLHFAGLFFASGWLIIQNNLNRPPDWSQNMPAIRDVSKIVADDVKTNQISNFNIASLIDADARGTRFRYFLDVYGVKPEPIDQYPQNQHLYVVSHQSRNIDQTNPAWEIQSFQRSKYLDLGKFGNTNVYRLDK